MSGRQLKVKPLLRYDSGGVKSCINDIPVPLGYHGGGTRGPEARDRWERLRTVTEGASPPLPEGAVCLGAKRGGGRRPSALLPEFETR